MEAETLVLLSQGRGCSSCLHGQFKDSKWYETLATPKSMNISAFFLSGQNFAWILEELPHYSHASLTPKHHIFVTFNQVALLSFRESSPTRKSSLSSTDQLAALVQQRDLPSPPAF